MGAKRRCLVNNIVIRCWQLGRMQCTGQPKKNGGCEARTAKRGSGSDHGPTKASGERWGPGEGKQRPSTQTQPGVYVAEILLKATQFCSSVFVNIMIHMLPMSVHRDFVHFVLCILCFAFAFSLLES